MTTNIPHPHNNLQRRKSLGAQNLHCLKLTNHTPIIYESVTTTFNWNIFIDSLIKELIIPFALPFYIWRDGFYFLYSQIIIQPTYRGNIQYTWGYPIAMYLLVIFFFLIPSEDRLSNLEIFIPINIYLCHKIMVSIKVGSLFCLAI